MVPSEDCETEQGNRAEIEGGIRAGRDVRAGRDLAGRDIIHQEIDYRTEDIFEVAVTTLQNPLSGLGLVAKKIGERAKLEVAGEG